MNFILSPLAASLYFTAAVTTGFLWGYRFVKHSRNGWNLHDKLTAALIFPLALSTFCLYGSKIIRATGEERNWMRLVTTFAFFDGKSVYAALESGPALATIYGPVSFIAYWPATQLADPFLMVRLASLLSALFMVLPLFLVITHTDWKDVRRRNFCLLVFCVISCMPFIITSLKDVFFLVHADPPALGLILLSGGFLYIFCQKNRTAGYLLSAAAYALGIWAKQVTLPVILPLFLYVLWMHGGRQAFLYLVYLVLAVTAVTAAVLMRFSPSELYFNMVILPSSHALRELNLQSVFHYLWKIFRECMIPTGTLLACLAAAKAAKLPLSLRKAPWSVFLWITLVMLPVTFYIHLKEGASNNTFAYSNYFFLTAAGLFLIQLYSTKETRIFASNILLPGAVILMLITIPSVYYRTLQNTDYLNDIRRAYDFNRQHPGEVYIPRMSLMNYLIDGELYHSVDGLRDRKWAGIPVTGQHFRENIPAKLKYIVFIKENYLDLIPLPEFSRETGSEPGMEGISVITTEDNR